VFVWYLSADRMTPFTSQARIQSLVVPIVPRVSGHITEVEVGLHSIVAEGDVLFQLDRRPFQVAVDAAEAGLDKATKELGSQGASVKSAAGHLGVARAQLDRAQRSYDRAQSILAENPGALSLSDKDQTETSLAQALERVSSAEADLEKAKKEMGVEGPENAMIRKALAAVEQTHLNLEFTTIRAPSSGVIENFNVGVGHYAQTGQPLATFVTTHDVWIQADMRENNLGNIKSGSPVEIVFDAAPGEVFKGTVRSVGYGVSTGAANSRGQLPAVGSSKGWLREPQRFPVIIDLNEPPAEGRLRIGGQVDVIVYTGDDWLLNPLGRLVIRIKSWLSYVR
jgi:multidrug resistance efflux pump